MKKEMIYARIGTQLYKKINMPVSSGGTSEQLIPWKYGTLHQDYPKDEMPDIPKFDGFCTIPSHTDYQDVVDNFLNLYKPISHQPKEGPFENIQSLMHHIFGEQYELGMDYLQLLYLKPMQKLPILLLVSEERNTGKTTFLNFLKAMFEENATFNTNEDFRSQFNADWAGKLLIVVDEVLLSRREDSERLKNLSTALNYKIEAKGKDRQEIDFFAKFVLCSNNESFPVIIDPTETRYWVRKVSHLDSDDTGFLAKLKAEIPALFFYLQHRQLSTQNESRMWFAPATIRTEALDKIIASNRSKAEADIVDICIDIMDKMGTDSVCLVPNDLVCMLKGVGANHDLNSVRRVLKETWKLTPAPNALTYGTYIVDFSLPSGWQPVKRVGRFYTIYRNFLESL